MSQLSLFSSRCVGVVGSRALPSAWAPRVRAASASLLSRGFSLASGGALGADQFCLSAVLSLGATSRFSLFSAWQSLAEFPVAIRPSVSLLLASGGSVVWGTGASGQSCSVVTSALLARNQRLVSACSDGLVAFLAGSSHGSLATVHFALRSGVPVVVFPVGCGLPSFSGVSWHALSGSVWRGGFKSVFTIKK